MIGVGVYLTVVVTKSFRNVPYINVLPAYLKRATVKKKRRRTLPGKKYGNATQTLYFLEKYAAQYLSKMLRVR